MEVKILIKKMKHIQEVLLDYIETTDDNFCDIFLKEILENEKDANLVFQMISKIADNHHRSSDFINKIEKIFQYLIKNKPSPISEFITDYAKYNKWILLLLLENGLIIPDQPFLNYYYQLNQNKTIISKKSINNFQKDFYYLYPGMKPFLDKEMQEQIEEDIINYFEKDISTFNQKCQIGENDSYICSLIRDDLIETFVSYVNKNNISLSSLIEPSIYETNQFFINKMPTLIQYASFYGSIQIIQYLKYNEFPLTPSMWLYGIHSNNPELIHFLEENVEKLNKYSCKIIYQESIKCHHNAISQYIEDNYLTQTNDEKEMKNYSKCIFNSLNFNFLPDDISIDSIISNPRKENDFNLYYLSFTLTTITIPSSLHSIGDDAFKGCYSITTITIPSSIKSIGNNAFSCCSSLKEVSFKSHSNLNSIGNYAFAKCSSLTEISIPSSLTSINNGTFKGCSSLKEISIPFSIKSIGTNAFAKCLSLEKVIFESGSLLKSIGNNAFTKCSSLTQIAIPYFVNFIGNYSFANCSSLTQVLFEYSSARKVKYNIFKGCPSLKEISIPRSISSIGIYSFYGCSKLSNI